MSPTVTVPASDSSDQPLIKLSLPPTDVYLLLSALRTASHSHNEFAARTSSPAHSANATQKAIAIDKLSKEIAHILQQAEEAAVERFILDP